MKRLLKAFLLSCILALLTLFSVSFFWKNPLSLTLILVAISIIMLLIWRDKEDIYLYFIVFLSGGISEAIIIAFGGWAYAFPSSLGIPLWLPFLWGISGVFIKKISLEIHDFVKHK